MRGILADINVIGHVQVLLEILEGNYWGELWKELDLTIHTFDEIGLSPDVPDSLLWRRCQDLNIVLITTNRNAEGPESLEMTIRRENGPSSLPVLTSADNERVATDREYAVLTAEVLIDYLIRIDTLHGTGRLFLP